MVGNKFHYCCFFTDEDWANSICLAEIDQLDTSSDSIPQLISEPIQEQQFIGQKSALKCPKPNCDFETLEPHHLQKHVKSHVQCYVCFKEFSGRYAQRHYKRHQLEHQEKVAHICDVCQKLFQYASVLKQHKIRSKCGWQ